jgi:hypothetical protein
MHDDSSDISSHDASFGYLVGDAVATLKVA